MVGSWRVVIQAMSGCGPVRYLRSIHLESNGKSKRAQDEYVNRRSCTRTRTRTRCCCCIHAVSGAEVVNHAGAQMSGDTTVVKAAHSLTNRGLIDGRDTQVQASMPGGPSGSVNNIGTGKIYGDHLSIAAGTVNNDSATSAATLAACERLDLGMGVLNNSEPALVFSAGDLFLVGALDTSHQTTGRAALTRFLDDGHVPIDNNAVENSVRPVALGKTGCL